MPRSLTEPRPCSGGRHKPAERLAKAAALCDKRGAQLTALRRRVLELLWSYERPAGAYELIEALGEAGSRPVGPTTVYRALEFLTEQGLVSKIESRNAYVPCAHPERQHDCQFIICTSCGSSAEFEDSHVARLLAENATRLGFEVGRRIVEVEGKCADCVKAANAASDLETRQ